MKKYSIATSLLALCLSLLSASAQPHGRGGPGGPGGPPQGPGFDVTTAKIFGENSAFSASMEYKSVSKDKSLTMPGKISYLDGKSRFEVNLAEAKSPGMPPAEQMKEMGMDTMITVGRPDKKVAYMIYPGLQAYAEMPAPEKNSPTHAATCKIELVEIGKETVDGHACIKNKVVVTDEQGTQHEATSWNTTDMKKFPLKIQTTEDGNDITMLFKDVKLSKPDDALFNPPSGFTRYDSVQTMMMQEMMKKMGGGMPPMH